MKISEKQRWMLDSQKPQVKKPKRLEKRAMAGPNARGKLYNNNPELDTHSSSQCK